MAKMVTIWEADEAKDLCLHSDRQRIVLFTPFL
jgi:hypothetical protein